MATKIGAGYRREATAKIAEQQKEGSELLDVYKGVRTVRAMATASTRVEAETMEENVASGIERWVNKTRLLLEKYFTDEQFAREFASRANRRGGYGNIGFDPVEVGMRDGTNVLMSVLEQVPLLEEEERDLPTHILRVEPEAAMSDLRTLIGEAQDALAQATADDAGVDAMRSERDEWSTEAKRALREIWDGRQVLSRYVKLESRLKEDHEPYGTIKPSDEKQRDNLMQVWLGLVDELEYVLSLVDVAEEPATPSPPLSADAQFVAESRLDELRAITSSTWDLYKLIKLCEEINDNHDRGNWYAVGSLLRAVLDHVPPIFGHTSFAQVASNYSATTRDFKRQVGRLQELLRSTGNNFLHLPIRKKEPRPHEGQVDYSKEFDALLEEIIRILT